MQSPDTEISLHVSVAAQVLEVRRGSQAVERRYPVSTSRYGLGSEPGSLRTPLGCFRVHEKIGGGEPLGAVFKSRVAVVPDDVSSPDEDLVLTRILWLDGLEEHNRNTLERYIYIHGTNHEALIGQHASHGCVRMANADIAALYELTAIGTLVWITAD